MTKVVVAAALSLAAACARPDYGDCAFSCAASAACPGELECVAGWCRAGGETASCGAGEDIDASNVVTGTDATQSCWEYAPSNFDSCALPASIGDWLVEGNDAVFDTSDVTVEGVAPPSMTVVRQDDGSEVVLVIAGAIHVAPDKRIIARGRRPLLIVALGDVYLEGTVDVSSAGAQVGAGSSKCDDDGGQGGGGDVGPVAVDQPGAGGGGGGGFGSPGGAGGTGGCGDTENDGVCDSDGGSAGAAGAQASSLTLRPLRGGCVGGLGGGLPAGTGGPGGGAVQISTQRLLRIETEIMAGGGAGLSSDTDRAGGGGGGSGGAILLEGVDVELLPGTALCANGGGGGGVDAVNPSDDAMCSIAPAHGAQRGGDGAVEGIAAGDGLGEIIRAGGGGGGGGVGRIVVRALHLTDQEAISTPAYAE
ncbi:MAG TPA: hypothetical protein VMZ28_24590 [Kofleriaceae bacterium]|nr:hypothetical protein [Kofleriaceae bacterium]